jgi:ribonuclease H / adenosylcobalamin/alpha-ribazole phosphatase
MGKLILIRHGESEANREKFFAQDDTPLTDLGSRQALEAAAHIAARFRPAAVISSTLLRARQTAEIVAAELGLPVEVIPGLEECDFGFLKGQSYGVFREAIGRDPSYDPKRPWTWRPEGGESTEQTQRRVIPVMEQLREEHPDDDILVVCHGMVMLAIWAHFTGSWEGADVPPNCALVVVEHDAAQCLPPVLVTTS